MGAADPCYGDDDRDFFPEPRVLPLHAPPAGAPTMLEAIEAIVDSLPDAA